MHRAFIICLLLVTALHVAVCKNDKGNSPNGGQRGAKFNFKDCGGAKTCLGEERLANLLKKTGMHKSVEEIASILDQDDDLGFDTENEALVYACSNGIPPPPAGGPTLPEQAQGNPAAPGQQGHRKLLSSTHDHTGHHHHHNHHHHHHRRQILQKKGQNSPPAPAPAPAPSPSPAPVPSPSPAPATAAVVPEVASGWMPSATDAAGPVPLTQASAFSLHSRPNAPHRVLLDFDGHSTVGSAWNVASNLAEIVTPPYDKDNSPGTWSADELADIVAVWRSVAEDFAPFDVDITTEDPGAAAMAVNSTRVAIGGSYNDWLKQPMSGTAYIPAHNIPGPAPENSIVYYQPAFVFAVDLYNYAKYIQEGVAHEVGHALGLHHDLDTNPDGTVGSYSQGSGNFAPIMGASYYRDVTQFSDGSYPGGFEKEDDFAVISRFIPYIPQEQGSTLATATPLAMQQVSSTSFSRSLAGVVRDPQQVDVFRFTVPSSTTFKNGVYVTAQLLTLSPTGAGIARTNLRANLEVRRASSLTATTTSPVLVQTGSTIGPVSTIKLSPGVFYVSVWSAADVAYSTYGSRGQYQLTMSYWV